MARYLARSVLETLAAVVATVVLVFILLSLIPGSPWSRSGGVLTLVPENTERYRVLNARYGLDRPFEERLLRYLVGYVSPRGVFECGLICLNFGPSLVQSGRSNHAILFEPAPGKQLLDSRFGYSLRLVLLALLIAAGIGLPLGIVAAARQGSVLDHAISFLMATILSVPTFAIGLVLLIIFAGWLHIIKYVVTWADPRDWIMPAVILSLPLLGATARLTRTAMLDALPGDYVRTARGKGLHEVTIFAVHIFRNALVPVLAYLGPAGVELFATSIIVEHMFSFPGMGREFIDALVWLDYPMALSITAVYATMIGAIGLLIGFLRGVVDPRLRVV